MGSELIVVMMALSQVLKTFSQCSAVGKNQTELGKEKGTEDRKNSLVIAVNHESS